MNFLRCMSSGVIRVASLPSQPLLNYSFKRFRKPSFCDSCLLPPDKKPCFDIRNVSIEIATQANAKLIRAFLYTHHWPREPTVAALWMALDCPYLDVLTEKYAHSGDRFLALEHIERTGEDKLIGVLIANRVCPWMADELEEWAHFSISKPERHRMYFCAHCYRSPNFYKKYHVDYIYDVEVIATAAEVTGQGVATLLLKRLLDHAIDLRHPLVQVVATSSYLAKVCERAGMKREWSMDYAEFVDDAGQRVFYPRRPHHTVHIYTKYFDPKQSITLPCKPQYFK